MVSVSMTVVYVDMKWSCHLQVGKKRKWFYIE